MASTTTPEPAFRSTRFQTKPSRRRTGLREAIRASVDLRNSEDRHLLIVDRDNRFLYELYNVFYDGSQWHAGSGAFFDLQASARRPNGWTSADAAGLAILPGLVRYDEALGAAEITPRLQGHCSLHQRRGVSSVTHGGFDHWRAPDGRAIAAQVVAEPVDVHAGGAAHFSGDAALRFDRGRQRL